MGRLLRIPPHKLNYIDDTPPTISNDGCDGLPSKALASSPINLLLRLLMASFTCLLRYIEVYINGFVTL